MHCCPLDGPDTSTLHSALSVLVHLLLEPRSIELSPQDLGVVWMWSPSSDRSFIGRSTMVWVRINLCSPQTVPNWWSQNLILSVLMDDLWYLLSRIEKAKEVFIGVMPVENAPMLKSAYQFLRKFLTNVPLVFSCPFTWVPFPFFIVCFGLVQLCLLMLFWAFFS